MDILNDFSNFGLSDAVMEAVKAKGFAAPTPIQTIALPRLLSEEGHLVVKARTGTGKTAAFGIPLVEKFTTPGHAPNALILTPTRELCQQIVKEIASLTSRPFPRITAVYGGSSIRNQILELKRGAEIVAGTPGRVLDLMERKVLDLSSVEFFILDEADEMLDMGFFDDVEAILKAVKPDRRVALFSATMPDPILRVVKTYIGDVEILEDAAPEDEKPAVDQFYLIVKKEDRLEALRRIIDGSDDFYGLIFCATKIGADELCRRLMENSYHAEAIHGDLSQEARERTLRRFRNRLTTILVATDVAARGLDIEKLTHVINWDIPHDRETYVHRIGRTGRAGRRGRAISLALPSERSRMSQFSRSMERILGGPIAFMKPPTVKSVMKSLKRHIINTAMEAVPTDDELETGSWESEGENASSTQTAPFAKTPPESGVMDETTKEDKKSALLVDPVGAVSRELIDKLGAEKAVGALITLSFGELLDPSRYGAITEFLETTPREEARRDSRSPRHSAYRRGDAARERRDQRGKGRRFSDEITGPGAPSIDGRLPFDSLRVYVGLGRQHGATPRDIAQLLARTGNVPNHLVDAIEMKDFCAFATMPEDAARRACGYSRSNKDATVVKPAVARR
ncbi:MAG: DEAD/DEAH box helicase [Treponema sp.]|jgi:ATP-dependent RNA helicase DeaD|nr:DEAD/DEAH box helicase [Treponema sp.]